MIIDEYDLSEYTRDELIEVIRNQDDYIAELEYEIKKLERKISDKIGKDYDENKCLVADLLTNLVNEVE